jgi:WD40 repeat protein
MVTTQNSVPVPVFLQPANDYAVDCLAFSSDGQFLASAGQSEQVKIWKLSSDSPQSVMLHRNQREIPSPLLTKAPVLVSPVGLSVRLSFAERERAS